MADEVLGHRRQGRSSDDGEVQEARAEAWIGAGVLKQLVPFGPDAFEDLAPSDQRGYPRWRGEMSATRPAGHEPSWSTSRSDPGDCPEPFAHDDGPGHREEGLTRTGAPGYGGPP